MANKKRDKSLVIITLKSNLVDTAVKKFIEAV